MTHGATLGGHAVQAAVERAGIDPAEVEDVLMGCANPEGATGVQHRAPDRAARRPAGHRRGRHRQPLLLVGPADHRAWPRSASSPARATCYVAGGVECISCVQNEMNQHMIARPLADRAQARDLLDHAADRRDRWPSATTSPRERHGRVRRAQPAAGLRRPGRRQVQRRDRADHRHGRRGRPGDWALRTQGSDRQQPTRASRAGTTYEGVARSSPRCRAA